MIFFVFFRLIIGIFHGFYTLKNDKRLYKMHNPAYDYNVKSNARSALKSLTI